MTTPISEMSHTKSLDEKINKSITSNNDNPTSREKLIDKISSEQAINRILDKYRHFVDIYSVSDGVGLLLMEIIMELLLIVIYVHYLLNLKNLLNPQQIIKENYSILMLKLLT